MRFSRRGALGTHSAWEVRMESVSPKAVLRDVLIGFGFGLVLMVSIGVATTAFASPPAAPAVTVE
jgi:hypothetical protein